MKSPLNAWRSLLLLCLTLGLAPFFPEPHVWGKLMWVLGGAKGMQTMDWLDLLMHGAPWLLLAGWATGSVIRRAGKRA
jgi:hypothetical protein